MKQLYKTVILLTVLISLFSCVEKDEDVISTQDLLFGKWKTVEMKVNGTSQSLTQCELVATLEFTVTDVIYTKYNYNEISSSCELDEELTVPYTFIDDYKFRVSGENGYINTEIIELNTETLILKALVNNGTVIKESTYSRIN